MGESNSVSFNSTSNREMDLVSVINSKRDNDTTGLLPLDFTRNFTFLQIETSKGLLPLDMQFNGSHRLAISMYTLQMIFSAIGNLYVFALIARLRWRGKLSRINLFLLHLTVADLLVTFLMMPLEIGWNTTVTWDAGDGMCRFMSFFRIFGLYLSGFVLVCISLDRYFSVMKPLNTCDANRRARIMLVFAWIGSVICSLPQVLIFHLEVHPEYRWYEQCVTFNSFPTPGTELAYNLTGFFFLYVFPLTMILFSYSCILCKMYRVSGQNRTDEELARINMGALGRAKTRTLKMTIIIVAVFFFCWTPYNIMSLWYWFDKKSAQEVDQHIQKALFMFACTNSCINPIIYGIFHFRPWQKTGVVPDTVRDGCGGAAQSATVRSRIFWNPNQCCMIECESSDGDTSGSPRGTSSFPSRNHAGFGTQEENLPQDNRTWDAFEMEEFNRRLNGEGENAPCLIGESDGSNELETPVISTICEGVQIN